MIIKYITKYLKGGMSEEQALQLWVHLIRHPEDLSLLETCLMYREWYRRKREKGEGGDGTRKAWNGNAGAGGADEEGRLVKVLSGVILFPELSESGSVARTGYWGRIDNLP